jgi:putative SOS response-associated peptidase YedK
MPLVLPVDQRAVWLAGGESEAAGLLDSIEPEWISGLELRRVGAAVGNVRNNSPALIESVVDSQLSVDETHPVDLTLF